MTKREIAIGVTGFTLAVLLAGSGYLAFIKDSPKKTAAKTQTVGDHTISLNQADETQQSGGLSVNSAQNLGQLGGQKTDTTQGTSSGSGSASSGSSSNGLDPSTFGQYDKYKNETNALFGEAQVGTGAELTSGKKATVVYKGWLTNGTIFDQSRTGSDGKLQAFQFTEGAGQVIPGWEQGLAGMKVGGQRLVIVPPSVGYGAQQQGSIPPNSVLVFLVQLVNVE